MIGALKEKLRAVSCAQEMERPMAMSLLSAKYATTP
jgi:hypothetical protein